MQLEMLVLLLFCMLHYVLGKPAPPYAGSTVKKSDENQEVNGRGIQLVDAVQKPHSNSQVIKEPMAGHEVKDKIQVINKHAVEELLVNSNKDNIVKNKNPGIDLGLKSLVKDAVDDGDVAKLGKEGDAAVKFVKIPDGVKKLDVDKLRPVDHMDAVKMEQDGHINKDYHREMFLGNHEEFENNHYEEAESKLKDIVYKVDTDQDSLLSVTELEAWVLKKMEEHFAEAMEENEEIFKHLDPDGNGKVHWKEYYVHFLLAKGFEKQQAEQHVVDYDQIVLDPDSKEELIRYKFRWSDADTDPLDNELTREEFMSFRHPEQSDKTLNNMVISIMSGIDANGDGVITEDEFTALPPGEVEGEEFQAMDRNWQKERREEFRKSMDLDHDGKVVKDELKKYLDPRNPVQAFMEAKNIMSFIDDNHDGMLSMEEILRHKDIFISSKFAIKLKY
ncbi:45 kDa calcium-binding protein-like isoform X2 [Pomacea canaliculata]|uniref:45 kDa calcium-binding protein-like isoform X2 n=1 Tax=Pomacea canaliculata TaxID=400727 RepID=UPI000D72D2AA|nr:45 kDa calcium-binding protein-like isoform X2 [Pomacea canaliculata]